MRQPQWKIVWQFLKNSTQNYPMIKQFQLLGLQSKDRKLKQIYIPIYQCSFQHYSLCPKSGNNTCPSKNEWINKMCHTYAMEHYLAIESNKILITCFYMDEIWKHYDQLNKPDTKRQILKDPIYMKYCSICPLFVTINIYPCTYTLTHM